MRSITLFKRKIKLYKETNPEKDDLCYMYYKIFLGSLMKRGLKCKAKKKFNKLLFLLKKRFKTTSNDVFLASMLKIAPEVILKHYRRGSTKQIYVKPATNKQKIGLSVRYVIKSVIANQKTNNANTNKLLTVMAESIRNKGLAIKKKKNLQISYG